MNLNNLRISTRLFSLLGFLALVLVGIGVMGLMGIGRANDAFKTVYEDRLVPLDQLASIEARMQSSQNAVLIALVSPTPEVAQKSVQRIEAELTEIEQIWKAYMATYLTPEEAILAKAFSGAREQFVAEGVRPIVSALRTANMPEVQRVTTEKAQVLWQTAHDGLRKLTELQLRVAKEEYDTSVQRYATTRWLSIGAIIMGLLTAAFFGLSLVHGIGRSLRQAQQAAQAVAQGDMGHLIVIDGKDEIADLLHTLTAMQSRLTEVVSSVRQGSEGVATASAEIAQGNQDLSARTESQASALEQTASSMEQLNVAVRQNADSAQQANQLAKTASQTALAGGEVVAQVVETMKHINDSSKRIFDIISVIDSIAFQTNILALNAAVEAARAGEQGRGFAVVASEVRSLAGRSAEAAKEIKSLIGASVERVEAGAALVEKAGATMNDVVNSIQHVTDLMGEISSASREQSAGVAQVGEAVSQMDQVTQQNAALVEEMAAAASNLRTQSQDLVHTVSVFKLPNASSELPGNLGSVKVPKNATMMLSYR